MTFDLSIIVFKISALLGVIGVGALLKKYKMLPENVLAPLNKVIVDIFLPAMIFSRLIITTPWEKVEQHIHLPLIAIALFGGSLFVALFISKLFASKEQTRPVMFLAATANWIYLPYPVMAALYGKVGEQIVLLLNVGALCTIWTLGLGMLTSTHSFKTSAPNFSHVSSSPGLFAS